MWSEICDLVPLEVNEEDVKEYKKKIVKKKKQRRKKLWINKY